MSKTSEWSVLITTCQRVLDSVLHNEGDALHGNYWRDPDLFGMPGSHGCVSMLDDQAGVLWQFAEIGTPLRIRR